MNQDKQENLFERAVKGWTDLSRRSLSDASRFAVSLTEAGSRLMADGSRTLGEWASQVSDAAGKARDLVGREAEAGKSRGQLASDIATQLGSASSAAVRGYGQALRKSVEHVAQRYRDRDGGGEAAATGATTEAAATEAAPEPGIGTSPRSTDARPE